jgi:hypothetical protein
MVHIAKHQVKEYGILASPKLKHGRSLDPEVVNTTEKFCCNGLSQAYSEIKEITFWSKVGFLKYASLWNRKCQKLFLHIIR